MFCPEDGTELAIAASNTETVVYEHCPGCGAVWAYCNGQYAPDGDELLKMMEVGKDLRQALDTTFGEQPAV